VMSCAACCWSIASSLTTCRAASLP